ncbi:chorismate mutase [Paenibacillus lignilyticus]|uniref:Chorismate mutase n=1 Tax=Paenibacillus lignilyticus TaxID=1172615 RepID=A0ABS5CD36_9BACL|nr:chorismate mutase [Paenibacillus lignilyticus]MBP3963904.1 chorismate mutase [Paenibacillus lignilyticus]
MTTGLDELRQNIDSIDNELVALLAKRFQLTEEVGHYKAIHNLQAQDASREAKQFLKIVQLSEAHGLNAAYATAIFRCVMDQVIARHEELRNVSVPR